MNSDPEGKDSLGVEVGVGEDMKSYGFDIARTFFFSKTDGFDNQNLFFMIDLSKPSIT